MVVDENCICLSESEILYINLAGGDSRKYCLVKYKNIFISIPGGGFKFMRKSLFLFVMAVCIIPAFVVPSSALDVGVWDFYGSVRMTGQYWLRGSWYKPDSAGKTLYDSIPLHRFIWDLEPMSRFGALGKKGKFDFRFEAGWSPTIKEFQIGVFTAGGSSPPVSEKFRSGLILRRLYGDWFINDHFSLLIGQEWDIANFFPSSQVFENEEGLDYCGSLSTGRFPQVKFTAMDKFDFGSENNWLSVKGEAAVIKADTFTIMLNGLANTETEENMPKLEGGLSLEYNFGLINAKMKLVGGYESYDLIANREMPQTTLKATVGADCEGMDIDLSVWKFRVSFAYAQGTNLASYGADMGDPEGWRGTQAVSMFYPTWGARDTDVTNQNIGLCNTFTKEDCLVLNFQPIKLVALEFGSGWIVNHHDDLGLQSQASSPLFLNLMKRSAWYVNLQFNLLDDHLKIIPEFSYSDLGGGTNSDGGIWRSFALLLQYDM